MSLNLNQFGRFISALSLGKLPNQSQLDLILNAFLQSPIFLDPTYQFIDSLKSFLECFRQFANSKNAQDQFQRLLHATSNLDLQPIIKLPSTSTQRSSTPQQVSQSILDFLNLLFSSNDFRSLTNDTIDLLIQIIIPNQKTKNPQDLIDNISKSLVSILIRINHTLKINILNSVSRLGEVVKEYGNYLGDEIDKNQEIGEVLEIGFDLVCQFTGKDKWNEFGESMKEVVEIVKNDQELKKISDDFHKLISESLENSELVYTSTFYKRLESILTKLWQHLKPEKFQTPLQKLIKIINQMKEEIINDELSIRLIKSLSDLMSQVQFDVLEKSVDGVKTKVSRSRIWKELWVYLLPKLLAMIQEIPLPRIEFVSREIEFAIDPLTLRSTSSFMPDQIRLTNKNVINFKHTSPITTTSSSIHTSSINSTQTLMIKGLRLFTKDVGFYFKKKIDPEKSWFSRLTTSEFEDEGLLDVFVGMGNEDGISLVMEIEIGENQNENKKDDRLFKVKTTHFDLQGLNLYPHDSTHPVLNWFLKPGLALYLQSKLSETVESYITHQLKLLEELIEKIQTRWDRSSLSKPSTSSPQEEGEGPKKRLYGTNLKIEAEDKSYMISIGMGDNLLKGKGIGGRKGGDLKRVRQIAGSVVEEARVAVQNKLERVDQFVEAIEEGRKEGVDENDWRSDAFDL